MHAEISTKRLVDVVSSRLSEFTWETEDGEVWRPQPVTVVLDTAHVVTLLVQLQQQLVAVMVVLVRHKLMANHLTRCTVLDRERRVKASQTPLLLSLLITFKPSTSYTTVTVTDCCNHVPILASNCVMNWEKWPFLIISKQNFTKIVIRFRFVIIPYNQFWRVVIENRGNEKQHLVIILSCTIDTKKVDVPCWSIDIVRS